jgi:cellulose synthase/poly-beta-1,6-N-acetylglucosamine synthase-like glycosyltransferase
LRLDYPELEVIVVNDGSTDATLPELIREFHLLETDLLYVPEIPTSPVCRLYLSEDHPRLLVLDKLAGGSKADAVNAALNAASSPYICVVDADAVLEPDALLRIMAPMIAEPRDIVATGGIIRAVNGSRVEQGEVREVRLPGRPLEVLQVIEYLRSFLVGLEGWARLNLLLIVSGAFGIFRKDLVKEIGGYRSSAIGEDMDIVTRLHRHLREQKMPYRIGFVPDPVCWTEVPRDSKSLGRQRSRWQRGFIDILWRNRKMLCNPRYGSVGLFAMPYHRLFELLAPLIEVVGYTTMLLAALLGVLSRAFFLRFLVFGYAFATLISIGAVLQEEVTYRRYNDWRDVARLVTFCFLEHFPYRQLQMWWRLRGIAQYLRGDRAWGQMQRQGFQSQPAGSRRST